MPQTRQRSASSKISKPPVVATPDETIQALLHRAARRSAAVPISKMFLQQGSGRFRIPGPLAELVRRRDERALDLLLLAHATATADPYDITEAAAVWARTLDLGSSESSLTAVSKAFRRLSERQLVARTRVGRRLQVTLLEPDGSGAPYRHPSSTSAGYLKLSFDYWVEGWHRRLGLPGKAFLLIALSLADAFPLPAERGPEWYGISADTIERGVADLEAHGLLQVDRVSKVAPLAPEGYTIENRYTLRAPFGPRGVRAKGAPEVADT